MNTRGSRIIASDEDGNRVTVEYDDRLSSSQNHDSAVIALCKKMRWEGHLVSGGLGKTDRVYAWIENELVSCARLWVSQDDNSLVPYNGHPFAAWGVLTVGKSFDEMQRRHETT
jgi:hypothetical protein